MYVAVKGGEAAIDNAHRLLADRRRGNRSVPSNRNTRQAILDVPTSSTATTPR